MKNENKAGYRKETGERRGMSKGTHAGFYPLASSRMRKVPQDTGKAPCFLSLTPHLPRMKLKLLVAVVASFQSYEA